MMVATLQQCSKGSFTIIDIYESVLRVIFLMTHLLKAYSEMLIFKLHVALHRSALKRVKKHVSNTGPL